MRIILDARTQHLRVVSEPSERDQRDLDTDAADCDGLADTGRAVILADRFGSYQCHPRYPGNEWAD